MEEVAVVALGLGSMGIDMGGDDGAETGIEFAHETEVTIGLGTRLNDFVKELVGRVWSVGGVGVEEGEVDIENVTVKVGCINMDKHVLVGTAGNGKMFRGKIMVRLVGCVCW